MQLRNVILGAATVVVMAGSAHAMPKLTTYNNGTISVKQPRGWTVTVNMQAGTIMMQENPKAMDSPTIVVVKGTYKAGTTAQQIMSQALRNMGVQPKITARQVEHGGNGLQILAETTYKGMSIRMGALTVVSPRTNESMFAAILTRTKRFDRIGGMRLLHAVAFTVRKAGLRGGMPTATPAPARAPAPRAPAGMRYVPFPKANITGAWDHVGIGGMMNRVDVHGRVTSTDSRGSGTSYRFYSNGRYKVFYLAQMVSGVCRSRARIGETGKFRYDGNTLTLYSGRYSGDICTCCVGNRTTKIKKRAAVRTYQVRGIAGKPHALVLRGKCAPYMVDAGCSSTNAIINGRKHDLTLNFNFGRSK